MLAEAVLGGHRAAQGLFYFSTPHLNSCSEKSNTRLPKGGRREEEEGAVLAAEDRKTHKFCLLIPKDKAKIAEKSGCSQSFTKQFQPMAKVASLKKTKRKKKRKGEGEKRDKNTPSRVGKTAIVIQVLECTKAEIRDLASLLNFKNNKSLQITPLIGFKLEF